MSLRDKVKQYDKKYGTGNFWRPEEGQNQIRFLTEPELYDDVYEGEAVGSFIAYILVRDTDGDEFALFTLPKSLVRWLADQEELGKFIGYPMSFDVMLFKQTTGKKATYVAVAVEPTNSPAITSQQQAVLAQAKPLTELVSILQKKKTANNRGNNMPALGTGSPALGSPQQKRNAAEVNPAFISFESGIKNCDTTDRLDKALEIINASTSMDDFEKDLLRGMIDSKRKELTGEAPAGEDIKVEDIPF